jgi:D-alanine-D-alanine ligase
MKPCRVLLLTHPDLVPPESLKGFSEEEINVWKTEYDVVSTLRGSGHEVMPLGVSNELRPIRDAVESFKPTWCSTCSKSFTARLSTTTAW